MICSKRNFFLFVLLMLWLSASACSPVISGQIRDQVPPGLTFEDVLADPDAYRGDMAIFSGTIIESVNLSDGTQLTVLEQPTDVSGRPAGGDETSGRFLAWALGYLDVAVYAPGRQVTVAGIIKGRKELPLGRTLYAYPLLEIREIHLWRPRIPVQLGFGFSYGNFMFRPYPYYWPYYWWDEP